MIIQAIVLVLFGACLGFLIIEDMRRFEIKLELLPLTVALGIFLAVQSGIELNDILAGGLVWGVPVALYYWMCPGRIGRGDIWLFATAGFCFGISGSLFGAIVFGLVSVVTAWAYAYARGKRFGRSIYPAAVPTCIALLAICVWRLSGDLSEQNVMFLASAPLLALAPVGVFLGMSINMYAASKWEVRHVA